MTNVAVIEGFFDRVANFATLAPVEVEHLFEMGIDETVMALAVPDDWVPIRMLWRTARVGERMPWGTLAINLSGSLLLGVAVGLVSVGVLADEARWVLGAGFLGGYTTFSTASFETVRLLQERGWSAAVVTGLVQLVAATALAGMGLWLGSLLG